MKTVIKVENLGKRYRIRHRKEGPYVALRDVLTAKGKSLVLSPWSLVRRWFAGKGLKPGAQRSGRHEEFWALQQVSFELKPGEVLGIVGRNGAGKSTLLKILSRITEPTTGRIEIDGRVTSLLEIGTGFHPELTGRENIFLNGAILGLSRTEIRSRFAQIVEFSELQRFVDTPVKRYSTGMFVRLAFAVAAHVDPDILILDEVLAVGDAAFQKKCLGKVREATHDGKTVVIVSHQSAALCEFCSRALLLAQGRIQTDGPPPNVLAEYATGPARKPQTAPSSGPVIRTAGVDRQELALGNLSLAVEFDSPYPLSPLFIGAVISNSLGSPIFGFNSRMDPLFDGTPVRSGVAWLKIPNLPLHPGLYRVSLWLGEKGQNTDHWPEAVAFQHFNSPSLPAGLQPEVVGSTRVAGRWTVIAKALSEYPVAANAKAAISGVDRPN